MATTKQTSVKKPLYTFTPDSVNVHADIEFSDGSKLSFDLSSFTPEIQAQLMMHGFKQKVIDAAAIPRNPETGASASDADKIEAMREVALRVESGVWRVVGEGGGGAKGGLLARALSTLYPDKDIPAWLDTLTDKQKNALREVPKVKAIIDELKAKTAKTPSVDAESLLATLGEAPV